MLLLPAPSPLNGDLLAGQLRAAGLPCDGVILDGADVTLMGLLNVEHKAQAQTVLDAHPPTAQAAATKAKTERTNETTVRDRASQALAANTTFLARATPTNAQVVEQAKALTQQNNALIRLLLNRFDGTD